ncbi:Eukaryotic translation initiation factor 4E [Tritrichomonas foetus]|uniref:Eukaryotic translation initiation factor 4E n=1 Tax=Tritrichomonas foetus TaxID=1144522 RepID=A0A1J4K8U2_9EUKA|nr:Eukaryotic translation initiation factor 4E [Tritrichomonas foetus]|eukprot:OHT07831.1 Eukaryotic translation initiation factor 4E [Tritrichomonas foetus]
MTANDEHPLPSSWEFWVIRTNYEYEIERIVSFSTIEEFWKNYLQLPDITKMKTGGFALFKKGIKPAWEDPVNQFGSKARILPQLNTEQFEYILRAMIGGTIDQKTAGTLNGLYVNATKKMTVELWFGSKVAGIDQQVLAQMIQMNSQDLVISPIRSK